MFPCWISLYGLPAVSAELERQRDRETERQGDRETGRQGQRQRRRQKQKQRQRQSEREGQRETEGDRERNSPHTLQRETAERERGKGEEREDRERGDREGGERITCRERRARKLLRLLTLSTRGGLAPVPLNNERGEGNHRVERSAQFVGDIG